MTNEIGSVEERLPSPWRGALVRFGLAIIVALFYVTIVLHYSYTPDDTYIYLQYAKNLASGGGFAFNPGIPSYGVTGPLWVLLIAAGAKAGLDPFIVAKTFDILFASLSIVVVYTLSVSLMRDRIYALAAALIFSFDAFFLRWSASGMETSFAVILVLLAVKYAYLGDFHIAAFVTGLLTLVRPEGALLFIVLLIDNTARAFLLGKDWRKFWIEFVVYGLVVAPWLVYSYVEFGSMVPNTQLAKSAAQWSLAAAFSSAWDSVVSLCSTQLLPLLVLAVGISFMIYKHGFGKVVRAFWPIVWVLVLLFGYAVLNVQVVSRYLVPAIPLIIIFAVWCLKQLEGWFGLSTRKTLLVLGILTSVTIVQNQILYRIVVVPHMDSFSRGMEKGIKPLAEWLRDNSPRTSSVLTPDVGLLGYVANRRVFDTAGLITPLVKRAFDGESYDEGMMQKKYRNVVTPNFIVDRSSIKQRLASDSLMPIMTSEFGSLGIRKSETTYYTLYKVVQ